MSTQLCLNCAALQQEIESQMERIADLNRDCTAQAKEFRALRKWQVNSGVPGYNAQYEERILALEEEVERLRQSGAEPGKARE